MPDPSLPYRLAFGLGFLLILLVIDVARHGRASRRLAEYTFLATATLTAMAYAVTNDLVAMQVSRSYFTEGKGLGDDAGPLDVAWLGMQAGWSPGLLLGVTLLFANQLGRAPALPINMLYRYLPRIVIVAVITALAGAFIGSTGILNAALGLEPTDITSAEVKAFVTVWGLILGGYAGALLGTVMAVRHLGAARSQGFNAPSCSSPP